MNAETIIQALDLPSRSLVSQRVPKKLLLDNSAPTAADKRVLNEGIEELTWVAALKPTTIGVPEYRDDVREYLEIAVLRLSLRTQAKATRIVELVHRAIPYPLLLLTEKAESTLSIELSATHKRWSQGELGKTVLEDDVVTASWDEEQDSKHWPAFLEALALGKQPHATLNSLYQGWIDTLLTLRAARISGIFKAAANAEDATLRREALQEYGRLDAEIARLRASAAKEKQMSRRVELNLELKRIEAARDVARANL